MILSNNITRRKIFSLILITLVCVLFSGSIHRVRAQMLLPAPLNPYFAPLPPIPIRLMNPFTINRLAPISTTPLPIMVSPYPVLRKAAVTTTLLPTPTALAVAPTALLLSLLFSTPTTATTITTGTGVTPNINSNNTTAAPVPALNTNPSIVAPTLPGLSSLFLPLLI
ncbi:MAG: hypothetical protein ACMUJM_14735 [bacterium]